MSRCAVRIAGDRKVPERPPDPKMEESTDRWMLWGIGFFVILVLAFPAYRLLEPGSRETTKEAYVNDLVVSGQQLFVDNCVACHGPDATGGIGPALNSKQFLGSASCLLYTSDAADDLTRVDLGGR